MISVFSILPPAVNAVYLYGNVLRPGKYAYKQGVSVLDILPDLESLDTDTYFDYALIKRYRLEDMEAELIPFDIGRLFLSKDESQNVALMPLDEVYIFNRRMFEDRAYAAIEGEVREPGSYFFDEKMRLKDLLFMAGGLSRDAYLDLGHLFRTDSHTKEVRILTFNPKKAMDGDLQHNLLLEDLDHMVIHSIWDYREEYTVSIKGMVHKPDEYPYVTDMMIKDLIMVAGNVRDAAYMERAELVRYDIVDGKEVRTSVLSFDVRRALENDPDHNLKLQPLDVVHIKEISEWWDKKKAVTISGEVYFPGTYQIRKDERLSDVIERAGGYKETAYLRGAFFTRESVRSIQQERLDDMIKRLEIEIATFSSREAQATLSEEDIAAQAQFVSAQNALVAKLRETKAAGRVVISLLPISVLRGSSSDLVLEDDDTLTIPPKTDTVNVLGSVYNPVALIYEEDRPELRYYLNKTGGPTADAEKDQMYIIRADGTIVSKKDISWFGISWSSEESRWGFGGRFDKTHLYPGDTVLVPQKVVQPSFMRDVKDITEIVYKIAVIAGFVAVAVI
jgi:protein involved in polysaccharide export with SLBB domain